MNNAINEIGNRYDRLLVVEEAGRNKKKSILRNNETI